MHVFPLQYRQLPGVNCVCRYHGGSPASSDSHQFEGSDTDQNSVLASVAQLQIIIKCLDRSRV